MTESMALRLFAIKANVSHLTPTVPYGNGRRRQCPPAPRLHWLPFQSLASLYVCPAVSLPASCWVRPSGRIPWCLQDQATSAWGQDGDAMPPWSAHRLLCSWKHEQRNTILPSLSSTSAPAHNEKRLRSPQEAGSPQEVGSRCLWESVGSCGLFSQKRQKWNKGKCTHAVRASLPSRVRIPALQG